MELGKRIRQIRKQQGLRLVDLSERSGICVRQLSNVERDTVNPRFESIAKIAEGLNITLKDLFSESHSDPAETLNLFHNNITLEKARQKTRWGAQSHPDENWYLMLSEEMGEVGKAIRENDTDTLYTELTRVVAVIESWIEQKRDPQNE